MESPMRIRQVKLLDLEEIVRIEQANFLGEEATSPEKLKEQIEKIEILPKNGYIYGSLNYKRKDGSRRDWIKEYYKKLEE